jgi:UDP-N-acetylglucosamine--N-acetylmuramyl-(pentapeptide) pyrophosphoryl-undecaprenol N-acetylglucosamine transferase
MAAGTGGHVYPALSTAAYLSEQGWHIDWLGSGKGIEQRLVPAAGYQLHCIDIAGLRGKGYGSLLGAPWRLSKALWQAWKIIGHLQPDCVLGMGGFVAGPGGLAAYLRRIPLLTHEQNAVAGLTNKLLRPLSWRVMQAFADTFADPSVLTVGNPIRADFARVRDVGLKSQEIKLLVVGGSLGALALNQVLPQVLAKLPAHISLQVRHQCGPQHLQTTCEAYQQQAVNAQVEAYIDDMPAAFGWADVIICRAGALTVSELAVAGKPAILVPYPYAVDDHQTANAQILVAAGAAVLMPQAQMQADSLVQALLPLLTQTELRQNMAQAAFSVAQPQATQAVAQQCMEAISG